ncbi:MAG: hypothetical protein A2139_06655 [Desulfobacca sp. RBG_16_60_12]|nr:MAG: hypothetical protein A2139_06655 [Desulfobacca sp. RBG_16_60_12]
MSKRRISRKPFLLADQLRSAAEAAAAEPQWPSSAPSPPELQAASDSLRALITGIIGAENDLSNMRGQLEIDLKSDVAMMRRVDFTTSMLYGPSGHEKIGFGIRPIDAQRTTPPAPKAPTKLKLIDGPASAALTFDWKWVPNAKYHAEAWDGVPEAAGSVLLQSKYETASRAMFFGLPVGLLVFVRARILSGKRTGPWSRSLSRYVNV